MNPETTAALQKIQRLLLNISEDRWIEGEEDQDELWQALDDIDAIVLGVLPTDNEARSPMAKLYEAAYDEGGEPT